MNTRQQLYKQYRIEGLSAYKAARKAGYAHATAWNAHKNIEKRCNFNEELVKAGMDNDTIFKVLGEGLVATKTISATVVGNSPETSSTKYIDVPDFQVRHKYLETLLKLRGELKETFGDNPQGTKVIIVYPQKQETLQPANGREIRIDG